MLHTPCYVADRIHLKKPTGRPALWPARRVLLCATCAAAAAGDSAMTMAAARQEAPDGLSVITVSQQWGKRRGCTSAVLVLEGHKEFAVVPDELAAALPTIITSVMHVGKAV